MATLPNIFYFNPTCEMAIANGTVSWQPNRMLRQFEEDLELIVAFLASKEDIVLLRKLPSKGHRKKLEDFGIELPTMLQIDEALADSAFAQKPLNQITPWGWSPALVNQMKTILPNCADQHPLSVSTQWDDSSKNLFSRTTASDILQKIISNNDSEIVSKTVIPRVCTSEKELIENHQELQKSIIKAPWSSSGRGIQIVDREEIHPSILNWCRGMLKEQGYLMIEPLLNKQLDFAFQFEIKKHRVDYLGTSWFTTNEKKAYTGNYLQKELAPIPKEAQQLLYENEEHLVASLIKELEKAYLGKYQGMAGVDAMFVLDNVGNNRIHPCVEINLRYNMGNVAMALSPFATKGFKSFEISTRKEFNSNNQSERFSLTEGDTFCAFLK